MVDGIDIVRLVAPLLDVKRVVELATTLAAILMVGKQRVTHSIGSIATSSRTSVPANVYAKPNAIVRGIRIVRPAAYPKQVRDHTLASRDHPNGLAVGCGPIRTYRSGNVTVTRRWGLCGSQHKDTAESNAWLQIECMVSVIDKGPSA